MTSSRVPALLIAVLSISALGVAATTLDTTLSTDPEDEIDPDWDDLPIRQGDAATLREEIDGGERGSDSSETQPGEGDVEASGEADDRDAEGQTGSGLGELLQRARGGDEGETGGDSDSDSESGSGTGSSESGMGEGSSEQTLLDRLLALLADLLGVLVAIAAVVALVAIVYRYRDTLWSLLSADPSGDGTRSASGAAAWPGVDPTTAVDRAWLALVRRVDPERPETLTTAECRELAHERGLDAPAVDAITAAFERVHYGGAPAAEEAGRAQDALRRFEEGSG